MIGGDFGSTVSRNCTSAMSSIRPPFSEMLPAMRGVSIFTRGLAAMAASRATTGWACWPAPGVAGWVTLPGCGAVPGVAEAVGCGVDF
ncbi:hypothetical protein ACVIVD_009390 [Bradyrhizobium liaoningense]